MQRKNGNPNQLVFNSINSSGYSILTIGSIIRFHWVREMHVFYAQKSKPSITHEGYPGSSVLGRACPILQPSSRALPCGSHQSPQKCISHHNLKRRPQIKCRPDTHTFQGLGEVFPWYNICSHFWYINWIFTGPYRTHKEPSYILYSDNTLCKSLTFILWLVLIGWYGFCVLVG